MPQTKLAPSPPESRWSPNFFLNYFSIDFHFFILQFFATFFFSNLWQITFFNRFFFCPSNWLLIHKRPFFHKDFAKKIHSCIRQFLAHNSFSFAFCSFLLSFFLLFINLHLSSIFAFLPIYLRHHSWQFLCHSTARMSWHRIWNILYYFISFYDHRLPKIQYVQFIPFSLPIKCLHFAFASLSGTKFIPISISPFLGNFNGQKRVNREMRHPWPSHG